MATSRQHSYFKPGSETKKDGSKSDHTYDQQAPSKPESRMSFTEVQGDMFACCSRSSSLAHCVSEDMHMGKGIATIFKKEFGRVDELKRQGVKVGGVAVLSIPPECFVYYLVTKKKYFHKPTYDSLTSSLEAMRDHAVAHNIKELCMPRIGCGLDQLSWERVTKLIQDIFHGVPIIITIYYL